MNDRDIRTPEQLTNDERMLLHMLEREIEAAANVERSFHLTLQALMTGANPKRIAYVLAAGRLAQKYGVPGGCGVTYNEHETLLRKLVDDEIKRSDDPNATYSRMLEMLQGADLKRIAQGLGKCGPPGIPGPAGTSSSSEPPGPPGASPESGCFE